MLCFMQEPEPAPQFVELLARLFVGERIGLLLNREARFRSVWFIQSPGSPQSALDKHHQSHNPAQRSEVTAIYPLAATCDASAFAK